MEALRLRVKDVDFAYDPITLRDGGAFSPSPGPARILAAFQDCAPCLGQEA
jgi:hypothetical protein